jgi:hypothetical protein
VEEALIEKEEPIVADEETAKVAQVSEGALDFPAFAIAPQRASVLKDNSTAAPMRTDQLNPTGRQALTEALGVVSPITNEPLWAGAGTTCTRTGTCTALKVSSARVTSAGEALKSRLPRGIPWPSATTIHFVPLPRLVLPTQSPLFWPLQSCRP